MVFVLCRVTGFLSGWMGLCIGPATCFRNDFVLVWTKISYLNKFITWNTYIKVELVKYTFYLCKESIFFKYYYLFIHLKCFAALALARWDKTTQMKPNFICGQCDIMYVKSFFLLKKM